MKIFLTMLATKDADHVCRVTVYQLHKLAGKDEATVLKALKILESPDSIRRTPQPHEGRRIRKVEDGWLVLNSEKYREKATIMMRRASWARAQTKRRERLKAKEAAKHSPSQPMSPTPSAPSEEYIPFEQLSTQPPP